MNENIPSYIVAATASLGGYVFGYEVGVISSILEMHNFNEYFNNPTAIIKGTVAAITTLGSLVGSMLSGHLSDKISRKRTIILGGIIMIVGSAVQSSAVNVILLICGRLISGLGVGLLSATVPAYQSELSHPKIRGRLISLQQLAITIGVMVAFWVDFAFSRYKNSQFQWRGPLMMQLAFCLVFILQMFRMPYSPRWLLSKGKYEKAVRSLMFLRSTKDRNSEKILYEVSEIKREILRERELGISSYSKLFVFPNRRKMVLGVLIQAFQQLSGVNAMIYYAPRIFKTTNIMSDNDVFIAQGLFGVVSFLFTIPAVVYVDKWGRKKLLIIGAVGSGTCHLIVALASAFGSKKVFDSVGNQQTIYISTVASWVSVIFIYIFIIFFAFSWGPVGWIYPAEIFSTTVKAKGTSITTACNWGMNFLVALLSPLLLDKLGWMTYLFFMVPMYASAFIIYSFFPETKGKTYEEIDGMFYKSMWVNKQGKPGLPLRNVHMSAA
ncbi:High-affinity glucose transporter [Zancudomyces culisetae]|uniref:High-affinity glucose transporter n=1 Tax=Zancudomyces culisetae TaxID=1213189 RepID=A0A1R1PX12_ZANCU|nr:High-affinity glucose transporter [Zancudomyces culisetae]|eukprot:OMH85464.1 High-affinity glucose transporter [Zancudomyces culisetae]